jgi:DNA repair protein SbcD/Mre11
VPLKLLAVGDLHLGRRPGGLPEDLGSRAARALGPAAALQRLVAAAIAERVDVVALTGDLVEQEDDFFEAYADLYRGVRQLTEAGIAVVGVAGNHDVRVLPRLADELPQFRLLGRGGTWETFEIGSRDGTAAVLHGWSFAQASVTASPLLGHRFQRDRRPALGLLHCDRDRAGSRHAPVSSQELSDAGLDAWLLGHIHKPDALSASAASGYLGSVTALRRSETGPRGPWLYTIGARGIESVTQWPLAPLRWEVLELDVTGITEPEEARTRLLAAIRVAAGGVDTGGQLPDALGFRLHLVGRTRWRGEIERLLLNEVLADVPVGMRLRCFVGDWHIEILPDVDLEVLARQTDPAGLLAWRLELLDRPSADVERAALLRRARARLSAVARDGAWQQLHPGEPDDDMLAGWLRQAARHALDALLSQRRGGEERA